MFNQSAKAAFAAAAMTVAVTAATVPAPVSAQISAPSSNAFIPGGATRPVEIAAEILKGDGWYPIAEAQNSPGTTIAILRKKGSDDLMIAEHTKDETISLMASGSILSMKKQEFAGKKYDAAFPMVDENEDAMPMPMPMPRDRRPQEFTLDDYQTSVRGHTLCTSSNNMVKFMDGDFHQAPVAQFLSAAGRASGHLVTIFAAPFNKNGADWSMLEQAPGENESCLIFRGTRFRAGTAYPDAYAPPPRAPL